MISASPFPLLICSNETCGKSTAYETERATFSWCERCRAAVYCSRECQKEHWTAGQHRAACKPGVSADDYAHALVRKLMALDEDEMSLLLVRASNLAHRIWGPGSLMFLFRTRDEFLAFIIAAEVSSYDPGGVFPFSYFGTKRNGPLCKCCTPAGRGWSCDKPVTVYVKVPWNALFQEDRCAESGREGMYMGKFLVSAAEGAPQSLSDGSAFHLPTPGAVAKNPRSTGAQLRLVRKEKMPENAALRESMDLKRVFRAHRRNTFHRAVGAMQELLEEYGSPCTVEDDELCGQEAAMSSCEQKTFAVTLHEQKTDRRWKVYVYAHAHGRFV